MASLTVHSGCTLGGPVARLQLGDDARGGKRKTSLLNVHKAVNGFSQPALRHLHLPSLRVSRRGGHRVSMEGRFSATVLAMADAAEPITLGTAELPADCDLQKLESLMFKWATNLSANANVPMDYPLKVDRVANGVSLGFIKSNDAGAFEEFVRIEMTVSPPEGEYPNAMFRAVRDGPERETVPSGERALMQSMLVALKMAVGLSRPGK